MFSLSWKYKIYCLGKLYLWKKTCEKGTGPSGLHSSGPTALSPPQWCHHGSWCYMFLDFLLRDTKPTSLLSLTFFLPSPPPLIFFIDHVSIIGFFGGNDKFNLAFWETQKSTCNDVTWPHSHRFWPDHSWWRFKHMCVRKSRSVADVWVSLRSRTPLTCTSASLCLSFMYSRNIRQLQ